jgi:hypothetical protein
MFQGNADMNCTSAQVVGATAYLVKERPTKKTRTKAVCDQRAATWGETKESLAACVATAIHTEMEIVLAKTANTTATTCKDKATSAAQRGPGRSRSREKEQHLRTKDKRDDSSSRSREGPRLREKEQHRRTKDKRDASSSRRERPSASKKRQRKH